MNEAFESKIEEFEHQFIAGNEPDIRQFVDLQSGDNTELLSELIHTELELRLRAGEPVRAENYISKFRELADDHNFVRDLVRTEFNVRRNFDPSCRLEEYVVRFPSMRQSLVDEFLDSSVGNTDPDSTKLLQDTDSHSDRFARFRKQQLYEQGGLGNVWLARDSELDRDVVIKEIKSKYANSSTHRSRFARESKITGTLEHPGIVPVYGKGHALDGTPFFAMQFVQGENLRDSIRNYHKPSNQNDSRTFNHLINHFVDVCNTIEYAHSQGIVHRDIKPENIMVGQFGETYLIDWGLACTDGSSETPATKTNSSDSGLEVPVEPALSQDGQMIGSPAFMSPEQAKGDFSKIDKSTDVYSLGATLFSILTGIENPNREVDNSIKNEQYEFYIEPGQRPLLSVCSKAMSHAPSERYASVGELREDVESFLMDRPFVAHRESVFERWSRFLRQNRTFLTAAMAAMLAISIVSALAVTWINNERNDAIVARESESKLRAAAEHMQRQETLARTQAELRTAQLTNVLGIFADAVAGSDDAGLQVDPTQVTSTQIVADLESKIEENNDPIVRALLNAIVARSNRGAGNYEAAVEKYEDAIGMLDAENISHSDPLYADLLSGLAATLLSTGDMQKAAQLIDQIKAAYQQSPSLLEKTYFRILLMDVKLAIHKNDLDQALELATEANQLGRKIYADSPSNNNLTWANYVLADAHRKLGQLKPAVTLFEKILADRETKSKLHPLSIVSAVQLSEVRTQDSPEEALALIEQACKDADVVYGPEHPDTINIDARLGRLLSVYGDESSKARGMEIMESCRIRMIARLGRNSREALGVTLLLVDAWLKFDEADRTRSAIVVLKDTLQSLVELKEQNDGQLAFAAALYDRLARAHSSLGEQRQAIEAMDQSVDWATKAYGESSSITKKLQQKRDKLLHRPKTD